MKKLILLFLILLAFAISGCSQPNQKPDRTVGTSCEDCQLMFKGMPQRLSWQTTISEPAEPGEPLVISGVIYQADGKTPAPGVILYVYHTDNKGIYSPGTRQNSATRHGHLRGWMKTDAQGRYEFKTIRPASYPSQNAPQHIHPIIKEPGISLYWIDEYLFEDDPLLTNEERMRQEKRGGSGIIKLIQDDKGVWKGTRDIVLGLNIPDY